MDYPFPNATTGFDIQNSTLCAYVWRYSDLPEFNTNASFNDLLVKCIGTVLQANTQNFWVAYCNNPPNDGCPYGYCPNSDIAGMLTRISTYITSFATACLLELAEDKAELIWAQLLTIYSILVSTCIAIIHGNQLGRVHAELALLMVGSPLTCYMWSQTTYALLHFRSVKWNSATITRHFLLICVFVIYVAFVIIAMLNRTGGLFSQESCYKDGINVFAPFFLLTDVGLYSCALDFLCVGVFAVIEWHRRKAEWLEKTGWWYLTWQNLKVFRRRMWEKYPHTRFFAFVGMPFIAWVWTTELTAITAGGIVVGSMVTFGSLLTLFASLPPILAIFQAAAANQGAARVTGSSITMYEKTHNPDISESSIDLGLLEKRDYENESEAVSFRQWCKDFCHAIVAGWAWLLLSGIIVGAAVAAVVVGYELTNP